MKKKILIIGVIAISVVILCTLTGCKKNSENEINDIVTSDISNEENNDNNIIEQNSIENETNILSNDVQQNETKMETNTSNSNIEQNNKKSETNTNTSNNNSNKQSNAKTETNNQESSTNTSMPSNSNKQSNTETKETKQEKTLKVGDYELHYGKYEGNCTKLIDTTVEIATITINLKENGTYTYTSTNQGVSKNRSGSYTIIGRVIKLNDSESLEYTVMSDDSFIERQGSGYTYQYQED